MSDPVARNTIYEEKPATRVTILDAIDLDSEIERILKEQLLKIVHVSSPSFGKWEPELDTLLRIILWKLSIYQLGATFGQQLLSVKYGKEITPHRAAAWAVLTIGTRYIKQRTPELAALLVKPSNRDKVSQVVGFLELCVQTASMINFLLFLREGHYPSLADRLVGLKPVSAATASRVVGYSFMTRELLWHGFIELLVFVLPLVNYKYLQRYLRKILRLHRPGRTQQEPLVYTVATRCAVCQEPPVLPHHMGCAHSFCYYCLQSNRMADAKFECPTCGHSAEDPSAVEPVPARCCINPHFSRPIT